MKFLLAVAAVIAVAVASPTRNGLVTPVLAGSAPLPDIIAINPAGVIPVEPVDISPVLVEEAQSPVLAPALIDFPLTETGELITAESSPVEIIPAGVGSATSSAPLVQIILNINQAQSGVVAPAPVVVPELPAEIAADPVQVVDISPFPVSPVQVDEVGPIVADPVQVIESAPIAVSPVIIGTPIIPAPAVTLPEQLN